MEERPAHVVLTGSQPEHGSNSVTARDPRPIPLAPPRPILKLRRTSTSVHLCKLRSTSRPLEGLRMVRKRSEVYKVHRSSPRKPPRQKTPPQAKRDLQGRAGRCGDAEGSRPYPVFCRPAETPVTVSRTRLMNSALASSDNSSWLARTSRSARTCASDSASTNGLRTRTA